MPVPNPVGVIVVIFKCFLFYIYTYLVDTLYLNIISLMVWICVHWMAVYHISFSIYDQTIWHYANCCSFKSSEKNQILFTYVFKLTAENSQLYVKCFQIVWWSCMLVTIKSQDFHIQTTGNVHSCIY